MYEPTKELDRAFRDRLDGIMSSGEITPDQQQEMRDLLQSKGYDSEITKKVIDAWASSLGCRVASLPPWRRSAEEKPEDEATLSQVDTDLQPAERDHQDDFKVGDEVKLTKEKVVRSRGGGIVTLDTNAKGVVIADKFGDGQVLQVDFEGVKVDVKKDMLKTAAKKKLAQTEPPYSLDGWQPPPGWEIGKYGQPTAPASAICTSCNHTMGEHGHPETEKPCSACGCTDPCPEGC